MKKDNHQSIMIKYICPNCKTIYNNKKNAEKCLNIKVLFNFKIGDIVTCGHFRFGWFDGDSEWIAEKKESKKRYLYNFYYIITYIENKDHRARYHLLTLAMTESSGYRKGYTHDQNHVTPVLIKNPPKYIIESSKKYVNCKANYLI